MSKLFYHVMQDNAGNLLFDVSGTMRLAGSGTLATIYGDEALTVILPNPMTNHPSFGSFKCFLGAGDYDFYMAKSGYTFETLTGVQGHGTMAQQDASAVAITGGTIGGITSLSVPGQTGLGTAPLVGKSLTVGFESQFNAHVACNANLTVFGTSAFGITQVAGASFFVGASTHNYLKASTQAITIQPTDNDTGPGNAVMFANVASTPVGAISTNATTTTYNTTSDARLKHDVDDLTGELALVQALRPVKFKWLLDDSPGVGFLAHEVAQQVAGVITGEADAVNEDGSIRPMQMDHSKLVPYLVGAIKTLQARIAVLEDALGV
jgi:hypothetical protein